MVARGEPVVGAAIGAALAFYLLAASAESAVPDCRVSSALFVSLYAGLVALSSIAVSLSALRDRFRRSASRFALSFCIGAAIGAAAADRPRAEVSWGLDPRRVGAVSGVLISDPRLAGSGAMYAEIAPKESESVGGERASASGRLAVFYAAASAPSFARGAVVRFSGRAAEGRGGPVFKAASCSLVAPPPPLERLRADLRGGIRKRLSVVPWGGLASALLLGDKDGLDEGEAEAYVAAGCAHILALSGMHLALISALLSLALRPLLGLRKGLFAGCALVCAYVYLAGGQASLVRAALMYCVGAIGVWCNAPRRPLPLLSVAFLAQLVVDPVAARGLSFILSYAALAGLCTVGDAIDDLTRAWIPGPIRPALAASVGAFLATAAVSSAAFGLLRPIGIAASLVLAPLALLLMGGAGAFLALSSLSPVLGTPVDAVLRVAAAANASLVNAAAAAPAMPATSPSIVAGVSLAVAGLLVYGRNWRNNTRNRFDPIR